MADDRIINYVRKELRDGYTRESITDVLRDRGYAPDVIDEAFLQANAEKFSRNETRAEKEGLKTNNRIYIILAGVLAVIIIAAGILAFAAPKSEPLVVDGITPHLELRTMYFVDEYGEPISGFEFDDNDISVRLEISGTTNSVPDNGFYTIPLVITFYVFDPAGTMIKDATKTYEMEFVFDDKDFSLKTQLKPGDFEIGDGYYELEASIKDGFTQQSDFDTRDFAFVIV